MAKTRTITTFFGKSQQFDAGGAFAVTFYRPNTNPYSAAVSNPVTVDGIPVESGTSLNIRQNVGDMDHSQYDVVFPGGAGEDMLYIIRIMEQ
jgi:hypothetical protein